MRLLTMTDVTRVENRPVGAFVGSLIIGFTYSYGQALFPDLAYVILFLPMVLVLTLRPTGLFGRQAI